jgi:hypothetical protein
MSVNSTAESHSTPHPGPLLNDSNGKSLKPYRLYHRREDGKSVSVILQNRVVEAASAVEALRMAIGVLGNDAPAVQIEQDTAWATRHFGKFTDTWEAEPD